MADANKTTTKKKTWPKTLANLALLIILIWMFEGWGLLGFLLFILGLSLKRVWLGRKQIADIMKMAEITVWKKPLDKDMWKKGEMKRTKVKIVFGKSKLWMDALIWQMFLFVLCLFFFLYWALKQDTVYLILSGVTGVLALILWRIEKNEKNMHQQSS